MGEQPGCITGGPCNCDDFGGIELAFRKQNGKLPLPDKLSDTERLDWLEDQLWNGWALNEFHEAGGKPTYELVLSSSTECVSFEDETLRGAIDKAIEWEPPDA